MTSLDCMVMEKLIYSQKHW